MRRLLPLSVLILAAALTNATAQQPAEYKPFNAPASDEAVKAMKRFRLPKGVEARVWAAEPLLANIVSFAFDEKGRCYVAETYRLHHGVTDNRNHMNWLDDDLASRTVEDRVAMHKKFAGKNFHQEYEIEHDRVRLVEDTTGKGVADKSTVFADGFHNAADGIGSGVLAWKGNVYYTCLPDLWLLKDTKGTGKADVKKSLAYGFGVHVAFLGHDMHGLRIGPDGRLYFSIGDRGLNVKTAEGKQLFNPDSGAVLRCELDGSNLEIVATGLRNPQELAFDQYGNLFTVDNNSDSGDQVRLTYVVPGGDSGWRTGYQYGSSLSDRGPFNAEKIWHLKTPPEQPAYIVPPLAHICSGPSGLCFNYGATALPARYDNHFFICDFRGSPGGSGVFSFAVKPKGAAFELVDGHEAFWSILATDCDFGPDGGFYISDWVDGWNTTGKGRIYRFADPEAEKKPIVAETKKLLAEGFDQRSADELGALLAHGDLRVRQAAQMALAAPERKDGVPALTRAARSGKTLLARLHGVWGLGQVGRRDYAIVAPVLDELAGDPEPLVRVQVLKLYGEAPNASPAAREAVVAGLTDSEARVRFEAALTLRNKVFHQAGTLKAVTAYLKDSGSDAYLRHAGVMALVGLGQTDAGPVAALADDPSPNVRLGAVLALRRLHAPAIGRFLTDADPQVVLEAARAVHDEDALAPVLPQLAALLSRPITSEFVTARALNAHFRLGKAENADAVAAFAARADAPEKWRVEAVKMLGDWTRPGRRDRITGLTTDLGMRDVTLGGNALRAHLGGLFTGGDKLSKETATVAGKLGIKEVGPLLFDLVRDTTRPALVRAETLQALATLKDPRLDEALTLALADAEPRLRAEARTIRVRQRPQEAVALLGPVLEKGDTVEKQAAYASLAAAATPEADRLLAEHTTRLANGKIPPELRLDLVEAATARIKANSPFAVALQENLSLHQVAARDPKDPLAAYRDSLLGGDPEAGRRIFFYKVDVYCQRCHKVDGVGGIVGPELTGIGSKQKRDYLLESIVLPNAQIAKGYESVVLILKSGKSETGILKGETAEAVQLLTAEGQLKTVPRDRIDERLPGKSAMPEDLVKHLSARELRDLVAFLAELKEKGKTP